MKRHISTPLSLPEKCMVHQRVSSTSCDYEVFLSFCGHDTRKTFTDFLYRDLVKASIRTFRDEDELQKGEKIENILEAIEHSKVSIPIFSTNYVSRKWCMRELVKMLECQETRKQKIFPIFYDIKPSFVRELSASLENTLCEHEREFREETIQKWKESLIRIGSINGWVSDECFDGRQGRIVDDVVSTVLKELKKDINHKKSPSQLLLTQTESKEFHKNTDCILSKLGESGVLKIGIYGLGGVGKTTLAMNVYDNLTKSQSNFHGVYWITVSHDSNIYHLQAKFAKAIGVDLSNEDDEKLRAAKLSEALWEKGSFVLFLDDVWSYLQLEKLGIHDKMSMCKLVLTSRSLEVCRRMGCHNCFKMNPLSESEAWSLFMEKFGNEVKIFGEISQIAQSITKECGGLPLAIITLARSMRGVDDIHEWKDCLRMLKEAKQGPESMDLEVYSVLKLSYDRLNDKQLQQCLLYCAVYPEDYSIARGDLINLLIDVGLIKNGSREAQFDRGHAILNKLENVCLLENSSTSYTTCVKMHDLIRDVALRITRSTFMVKSGLSLKELPEAEEWGSELEVVSLMQNRIEEISVSPNCPKLSTLLLNGEEYGDFIIRRIENCFLEYLLELKVLDLSNTGIRELPDSVANLVNLRALLLCTCWELVSLPSVAKLSSLRKLDLLETSIEELPEGMENLVNLRYLDLRITRLEKIGVGIIEKLNNLCWFEIDWPEGDVEVIKRGELGCLQKLEEFEVRFRGWNEYTAFTKSVEKPNRYFVSRIGIGDDPYSEEVKGTAGNFTKIVRLFSGEVSCMPLPLPLPEDAEQLSFEYVNFKSQSLDELLPRDDGVVNLNDKCSYCQTSLCYLKSLVIEGCKEMKKLLTVRLLENLQNLEELSVSWCSELQELIASEEEEKGEEEQEVRRSTITAGGRMMVIREDDHELIEEDTNYNMTITLPSKLRLLHLKKLENLKSMSKKLLVCDSLEELEIRRCPKLKRIPLYLKPSTNGSGLSPPSSLKHIIVKAYKVEKAKEWWEALEWDVPQSSCQEPKTALQPFAKFEEYYDPEEED